MSSETDDRVDIGKAAGAGTLVLATGNAGKVRELSARLSETGWAVRSQAEFDVTEADEIGLSFIENAILKARHAAAATGLPAVADDSGLAVEALGGAPGIYSARYSGAGATDERNVQKLLTEMQGKTQRGAWFYCVLAYVAHADDPVPLIAEGRWQGAIAESPSGDGGFGYDPVFVPAGESCSAAQLSPEQKRALSHRGIALAKFIPDLQKKLAQLL